MGATVWRYLVPYRQDLAQVVADEQERIRRAGEYAGADWLTPHDMADMDLGDIMEATEGSGTHSLLDLVGVGPWGTAGAIAPAPDDVLIAWAGSATPPDEDATIGRLHAAAADNLSRWTGCAVVLHTDGQPSRWLLTGATGD